MSLQQEDYRVSLDAFEGPLDLLLFLIRRAEVDIVQIPVAAITDQYLSFLRRVEDIDVDLAGEFLVMAATLVEMKSRTIVPPEAAGEGAADELGSGEGAGAMDASAALDPRSELIRQLLAYQRVRIAADELEARRIEFSQRYPSRPARGSGAGAGGAGARMVAEGSADEAGQSGDVHEAPAELDLDIEDVHIIDLAEAYERIASSIDFARLGDHVVAMDDTPIALYREDLIDRLGRAEGSRLALRDVFEGHGRMQRIGFFLAMLELVRLRKICVRQDDIDADIEIALEAQAAEEVVTG